MANRELALGEAGATKFRARGKRIRAEAVVRLFNGRRVWVSATGATKREAEDRLGEAIGRRLGRPVDAQAIDDFTPLYVVVGQFFAQAYLEADRADAKPTRKRQSVDFHATTWKTHLRPHLAEVRLGEITPSLLEHVLNQIRQGAEGNPGSEAKAKRCYITLNLILKRAQLHGGLRFNPLSAVPRPRPRPKPVVALDAKGVGLVRAAVRRHDMGRQARSQRDGGRGPTGELALVLDVLFGTGLRIGEALALRWRDVVEDDGKLWVDVHATVVDVKTRGLTRQEVPKTASSDRLVPLPRFAAEAVRRRREAAGAAGPDDYVFPARGRSGQAGPRPHSRQNWSRGLRQALADQGLGSLGFTAHIARKTVATVVAEATGSDEIAGRLLGHKVSRSVASEHYIKRTRKTPDQTAAIQAFIERSEALVPPPGPIVVQP
ncbi:MAG: tyrosine-type recombinase/integrase [Bifidobacteriaceae bacterium]|jgi:integrase|nr:tyrosine-type recombinase/integrase [Bifidobacteriaceae bacterium]